GRREELTLILDTLTRARRHETVQLVTLIGSPGIGKSRLVWELRQTLEERLDEGTWLRGRCLPYRDGVAYVALPGVVQGQAGILETDDAAAAEQKLRASAREAVADENEASWVEEHLRPLVGLGGAPAGETRDEVFSAWRRYIEGLAERQPVVLAFED